MTTTASPSDPLTRRVIRVFISSTFRDMMRERDLLVKRVFPALRRICAKRFVTFTEVDLRWGITEEQAAEGKVLPLCLAEIERSRPYFIGLLGERYGWIPDEIPADILAAEPWLAEHVQGRKSVTELEILHGVLNDPKMDDHAFFYFRDPAYGIDPEKYPDLTDDERRELPERDIPWEIENLGPAEAARRTQERKDKLAALKQRIRDSKLPLVDPYADPEALAAIIEKQFTDLIDDLYPADQTPDPLTQERLMHEAHAKNKLFACIERPAHMAALSAFSDLADHGGKGLVVTGESGGGKTALLAAWTSSFILDHPTFVFQHYFGATPDSSSPDGFLRRLLGELKVRFGITDDIPADPDKLREALPLWLAQTTSKGRIVLVLDGLNQLRGSEADRHLVFLPRHFPPNVTVLASALPGPALDALRERGWAEHDLPRASEAEVDAMVGEYFRLLGRHVDTEGRPIQTPLRRQLVAAPGCKNPLFLRTVLEELRQFGSFEQLPARVAAYLEATTPKELFLAVLRRWQEDFDGKKPKAPDFALTRRALTHLWAAREGLSEPEWLDLLGMDSECKIQNSEFKIDAPLPRAYWTPLFLALEPHLSQRAGLFAYGHDFLRHAVEAAFVHSDGLQQTARLSLADYFEFHAHQREMNARKAAEWPHQLHAAQTWDRLEGCLTNIPLFLALYNDKTKWELTGYWHPLRQMGREIGGCYSLAYEQWTAVAANADAPHVPSEIGLFLLENGLYPAAEPMLRRALALGEQSLGEDHSTVATALNNLAQLLLATTRLAEVEPLMRQALAISERSYGTNHPEVAIVLSNMAGLLKATGRSSEADPLLRRALRLLEQNYGANHPKVAIALNNLAELLRHTAQLDEAEPLYRRALVIDEQSLGGSHPNVARDLNNLALLLHDAGRSMEAEPLYRRALAIDEQIHGTSHPDVARDLNNLGLLLHDTNRLREAESLYWRALAIDKQSFGEHHPDVARDFNNLAQVLQATHRLGAAEELMRRALTIDEQSLGENHSDVARDLNNLAQLLQATNRLAEAEPLMRRALAIDEQSCGANHPSVAIRLHNLACLLLNTNQLEEAEPLMRRALAIDEQTYGADHPNVAIRLNGLASLLWATNRRGDVEPLMRRMVKIFLKFTRTTRHPHPHLEAAANNYGRLLQAMGRSPEEARDIVLKLGRRFEVDLGGG